MLWLTTANLAIQLRDFPIRTATNIGQQAIVPVLSLINYILFAAWWRIRASLWEEIRPCKYPLQ